MSKRNVLIGGGLAVIIVAVVVFALVHKSNTTPAANTTSASANTNTPKSAATSSIITTKTDPTAGEFLASSNGSPLYTYGADTTGVSNCSGACIAAWPIYGPVSSSASLPTNITVITRSDGKVQYAYKGMPLYTFTSDSGSTPSGDGVSNFHLAKP